MSLIKKVELSKINVYLSAILLIGIAFLYYYRLLPFYEFSINLRDNSFLTEESYTEAQQNIFTFYLNWIFILCTVCVFFMKKHHVGNVISIILLVGSTMHLTKESIYMDEINFFRKEILQKSVLTPKSAEEFKKMILKEQKENLTNK